MLQGKSRIALLAATGAAVALLVGGLAVASNMGFKGRFVLTAGAKQWFSPPYTSPYKTADDLLKALAPGGGRVTRFLPTLSPTAEFWEGGGGRGPGFANRNFPLAPGEAYEIIPSFVAGDTDVVIVGAHDPFLLVPPALPPTEDDVLSVSETFNEGFLFQRQHLVSVPWHTTYQVAEDLRLDAGAAEGATVTVVRIQPGIPVPAFFSWNGTASSTGPFPKNFAIELGQGYTIIRADTSPGFIPAHF